MHQTDDTDVATTGSASGAWTRVAAFASAVDAGLEAWLSDTYRLGLTEYRALTLLSQQSDKELRITVLGQGIGLTQTSATRLVSRLESKGLARRDLCPDDGRGVYAVIAEAGEGLVREVREPFEARVRELLSKPGLHSPHLDASQTATAFAEVGALVRP